MDIKVNDMSLLNLLIYSLRYAMPRKTGASSQVLRACQSVYNLLSNEQQKILLESINSEVRYCYRIDNAGYKEDLAEWEDFVEQKKGR